MQIPTGYSQVSLLFTGASIPNGAAMTFGVKNDTALTPLAICNIVDTAWGASLRATYSTQASLSGILVKNGPHATGPSTLKSVSKVGTSAGAVAPPNVAVIIRKQTLLGGRRGRGRMFLPSIVETNLGDVGALVSGYLTSTQSAFTTFWVDLRAADVPPYLLHDKAYEWEIVNGQPRRVSTGAPIPDPTEITAFNVDSLAGTQRRRMRG